MPLRFPRSAGATGLFLLLLRATSLGGGFTRRKRFRGVQRLFASRRQSRVKRSEMALLEALTLKVHVLSLDEVTRTWLANVRRGRTPRELRLLHEAGWVRLADVLAHPPLELERPLLTWELGEPTPSLSAIAHHIQERFSGTPERTTIVTATAKAAKLLAGFSVRLKLASLDHDLHVGALYARLVRERPEDAADWLSEDTIAPERRDEILPDAVLRDADGRTRRVVEFAGRSYTAARLIDIHNDCAARSISWELW